MDLYELVFKCGEVEMASTSYLFSFFPFFFPVHTAGRYVPPHLRGKSGEPEAPPGHVGGRENGGGRGFRGGRGGGNGNPNFQNGRGGGRGGGFPGGRGGGGGNRSFGGGRATTNELGFHGSLKEDPRLEQELFGDEAHVTQGINFEKVGDIDNCIILV